MNEQIRTMLRSQPFRAFEIEMVDGRVVTITHHDFISVPPNARSQYVIVYDKQGSFEVLNTNLATSIRPLNGRAPGRRRRAG